jgi:hypothetical protein
MRGARERRIAFEDSPPLGAVLEARINALGARAELGLAQEDSPCSS